MKGTNHLLFLVFCVIIIFAISVSLRYLDNKRDINYAEKGLEQCIDNPNNKITRIIWVRDCEKYITTIRGERK